MGALAHAFADYLRALGDPTDFQFNARTYLRDGFGDDPAFRGLVAVSGRRVVGYLLYHLGYDCDLAARTLFVADLYVDESFRRRGAGRALMQAARAEAVRAKCCEMIWSVYDPNRAAYRFYRRLGAEDVDDLRFMHLRVEPRPKR